MKNYLFIMLLFTGIVDAQIINIPDANFKAALLASNPANINSVAHGFDYEIIDIDANHDGEIEQSEADAVYSISMYELGISSVEGLSGFTNLRSFACNVGNLTTIDVSSLAFLSYLSLDENQLTSLDVSSNTTLTWLSFRYNQITSINVAPLVLLGGLQSTANPLQTLDVSANSNLVYLECESNQLTSLDLSNLPMMQNLDCRINQISSLDLSHMPIITKLQVDGNLLTSLDFSTNPNIEELAFGSNQISSVDISSLSHLTKLYCSGNQLTTLDCNSNPMLTNLSCQFNNMQTLYIKNGSIETSPPSAFYYGNSLEYICADDGQIEAIREALLAGDLLDTVVGSYCSFTPGGDYNTITGNIRYDFNNNGCDVEDTTPTYLRVLLSDGTTSGSTFVNGSGEYTFLAGIGNFTVSPQLENPSYYTVSPASANVSFPLLDNSTQNQNFCMTANGSHSDLETVIVPMIPARPGFNAEYKIVYRNKGTVTTSDMLTFGFDSSILTLLSSAPEFSSESIGLLTYSITNLQPFEVREIVVDFHVNSPVNTPPVNINDVLSFTSSIYPVATDEMPLDNIFTFNQTVIGSYDPNSKTVLEGETAPMSDVGKYLHYMINFENTGTAPAQNIVVADVIDASKFDISSLQVMDSSHNVEAKITGDKIEFIFENINLPSRIAEPIGGHGNVLFKIKTLQTLNAGDTAANTANIFFDYNAPIATNEAHTTFAQLSASQFAADSSILIYPNPTKDKVRISAKTELKSVEVYDAAGRILQHLDKTGKSAEIDLSAKAKGVYFIKIISAKGSKVEKIIKK